MRQRRVGQLRVERSVVEPVEFERKEQQLGRDRVDALVHRLKKLRDRGVGDIAGAQQVGIAHDPAGGFLQPLVFRDRGAEFAAR